MIRFGISVTGFLAGLLLTLLCLHIGQHIDWHPLRPLVGAVAPPTPGCIDLDRCAFPPWWLMPTLIAVVLGPSISWASINFIAWRRWSSSAWLQAQGAVIALTVALHAFLAFA